MELLGALIQLGAAVLLLFFVASSVRSLRAGAPFVPMRRTFIAPLVAFAGIGPSDSVADLGCGDGRFCVAAARRGAKVVGYDISRFPLLLARLRAYHANLPWAITLRRADIRTTDLSGVSVAYLYLMPPITQELARTSLKSLPQGARVVSACFPIHPSPDAPFQLVEQRRIGYIDAYKYKRL
jgi:SAM-dependent methyltransferase